MSHLAIGLAIGLAAGVLSGLFGIGGGIVIVPALVFLGLEQHVATGTSLAALLMPVGLLGVFEYANRHQIRIPYAIGIAVGLTIGAFFGARVAGHLSGVVLRRSFAILMIGAAARMLMVKA